MAAEAQAPPPSLAHGTSPASTEKRELPVPEDDDGVAEERGLPEPKRRRACVAALDSVPGAAASSVAEEAEEGSPGSGCRGDGGGASFSFQHARGGFVALETTPKFGSFNPPPGGEAELAALDLRPAWHEADAEGSTEAVDDEVPAAAAAAAPGAEAEDERARDYWALSEVDGQVQESAVP